MRIRVVVEVLRVAASAVPNMPMSIGTAIDVVKTAAVVCLSVMAAIAGIYRKRRQSIRYLRIL